MDLETAIRSRRSIRKFKPDKIPRELILELVEAAQWAPSACNKQLWRFIAIEDDEIKEKLIKEAGSTPQIRKAPLVMVVLYQEGYTKLKYANIQSAAAAIQNMLLVAHARGLGGVWLASMGNVERVRKILGIPDNYLVIAYVALGYPDESPAPPERREASELISFGKFDLSSEKTYPCSYDPRDWSLSQIIDYREKSIWAKSPTPDSYPFGTGDEFEHEINQVLEWVRNEGKILEALPFAGTHTVPILREGGIGEYAVYELSPSPIRFVKERLSRAELSPDISCLVDRDRIPAPDKSFDAVLCFQKLEHFASFFLLDEIARVLKTGGKFILSFRNGESFYWLYWLYKYKLNARNEEVWNYGPFKPIRYSAVKNALTQRGFVIEEERGISPSPLSLGRMTKGNLSRFCRLVLLNLRKAS